MFTFLFIVSIITLTLLIWFKTDAAVEYTDLLTFGGRFGKKNVEYWNKKVTSPFPLTYPLYLKMKYNNFFIRLITCPICLSVWLSIIHCIVCSQTILMIPIVCVFTLIVYGLTCKLLSI